MTLPSEKLGDLIQNYIKEGIALKEQITDICIHSNGGIELNTAWGMSFEDRELAIRRINKKNKDQNPNAKEYM